MSGIVRTRRQMRSGLPGLMFCGFLLAANQTWAQPAGDESELVLEEVLVTAQKRDQSAQNIPISVHAFSAEMMHRLKADTLSDLQHSATSLNVVRSAGSQQRMGLRGVVDYSRNIGIDARMGVYIDGVFQGRSYTADQPLLGLQSVEILRGPQGTLFGKNTVSGAINLVTRKPGGEFEGIVDIETGNYAMYNASAYLSGQLSENLYASITVGNETRDGYFYNSTLDTDVGDFERKTARGQLRHLPNDRLEIILAGDYSKTNSNMPNQVNAALEAYNTVQNFPTTDDSEFFGGALTVNYSFDNDHTLTSITSYRQGEFLTAIDDDYTPLSLLDVTFDEDSDQFSQELRLVSPVNEKYDWVAGLFYFQNDLMMNRQGDVGEALFLPAFGPDVAPAIAGTTYIPAEIANKSFAAYVHGNYRFSPSLELTAGLRYTQEKKDVNWRQFNVPNNPVVAAGLEAATGVPFTQFPGVAFGAINYDPVTDDLNESDWSPTVGLNYFFNEDTMAYVKYSRAFKSGGWNADFASAGLENFAYGPESVDSYELGLKTTTQDDTLRFNITGFLSKFDDYQALQFVFNQAGNPAIQLTNAAKVTVKGVEMETTWVPLDRWMFNLNFTYADSVFDEFLNVIGEDFNGNTLPNAPRWKSFLGARYIQPLGDSGELAFSSSYNYVDSQHSVDSNSPCCNIDNYSLLNVRIAYRPASESWELALWGKNLADEEYWVRQINSILETRVKMWGVPRTYGLSFRYFFGA